MYCNFTVRGWGHTCMYLGFSRPHSQLNSTSKLRIYSLHTTSCQTDRQTDRETDRGAGRRKDRRKILQVDRQVTRGMYGRETSADKKRRTCRQTQTGRQADKETAEHPPDWLPPAQPWYWCHRDCPCTVRPRWTGGPGCPSPSAPRWSQSGSPSRPPPPHEAHELCLYMREISVGLDNCLHLKTFHHNEKHTMSVMIKGDIHVYLAHCKHERTM